LSLGAASSTTNPVPSRPRSISLMSYQFIGRVRVLYKPGKSKLWIGSLSPNGVTLL
jgi:hypothetical protein